MNSKLVVTKRDNKIISAYLDEGKLVEVESNPIEKQLVGSIIIGKVKNIVPNINAAFIDLGDNDKNCFLSLTENKQLIFTNENKSNNLKIGDELLVQVTKEGSSSKGPVVTCNISLTGKWVVLSVGKTKIGISSKITDTKIRKELTELVMPYSTKEYGFVVRTNAGIAPKESIIEEIKNLISKYNKLLAISKYRACYQVIYKEPHSFITAIRDKYNNFFNEVVIDDEQLYQETFDYFNEVYPKEELNIRKYQDENLSLYDLHSLGTKIENALKPKVWLKSGGYIVINPTEALVSIDVNTGKYIGKKKFESTILMINKEAAQEIARQLRLRNLSGIIIVDFIDMKEQKNKKDLMSYFKNYLDKDSIKCTLVGMTKLHLVELTRKKTKKTLYAQFGKNCPYCGKINYFR